MKKGEKTMYTYQPEDIPDDVVFPEELISEELEDLKKSLEEPIKRQVQAIEKIADYAKLQADTAYKVSNKADIKGWIAIIISLTGLLIELASNYQSVISFANKVISELIRTIQ